MKKLLSLVCAAAMTLSCLIGALPGAAAEETAAGATYYVSNGGRGGNDGSRDKPFPGLDAVNWKGLRPGDQVLLEAGSVFDGFIHLVDLHGTAEAPIKIGVYGEGPRPVINGKGQGIWFQDYGTKLDNDWHKRQGYVSSTILLYDCDFVEISGLEITNAVPNEKDRFQPGEDQTYGAGIMDRTGVAGAAKNGGTMEHIYLDDLYIHDVNGNIQDKHMNNGGIQLNALKPDREAETGIARYHDVRITNCTVENVSRAGICVGYTYKYALFQGASLSDDVVKTNGHTELYMANNYVKDAGNDAIVAMYAFRPVVEHNISDGAGADLPGYAGDTQRFCAAIWPWKCKDAVYQYNEAFNTVGERNGDGQAWDVDWSDGTVYQYNYSHNNGMGPILFCLNEATNGVFRYNLSYNDLGCYMTLQGNPNAKVYNNVFYTGPDKSVRILHAAPSKNNGPAYIANNIFFNDGGTVEENWNGSNPDGKIYTNNLYYGFETTPDDANKVVVEAAHRDTVFAGALTAPGAGSGIIHPHGVGADGATAFDGFKLAENSPAINAGVLVSGNGGRDFFGNALDASPDIGIHDTGTPSEILSLGSNKYQIDNNSHTITAVPGGLTVAQFVAGLFVENGVTITVKNGDGGVITDTTHLDLTGTVELSAAHTESVVSYTFIPDTDNSLKSAVFEVRGQTVSVPLTELSPTTVGQLKAGVTVAQTAGVKVTGSGGEEQGDDVPLADGMLLVLTAQSGEENTYTVTGKNRYHYVEDFVDRQQGNVWFAQLVKSETDYEDMTRWSRWGSWGDDESPYRNVGPDGNGKGVLCDSMSSSRADLGICMAFRAPAAGTVELSFADQPQLRKVQTTGTTRLVITKNGEAIPGRSYLVPNDTTALHIADFSIEVAAGDFLRLEARNEGAVNNASFYITPVLTYLEEVPVAEIGLSSTVYTIDNNAKTVANVPWGTTAAELKDAITPLDGTVVGNVSNGGEVLADDVPMTDAMTLTLAVRLGDDSGVYTITLNERVLTYEDYDRAGWTATAGSVETEDPSAPSWGDGVADFALDGDTNTKWHSAYAGCNREQVWITVDMKEAKEIARVSYLPRQSGGNNGKYRQYEILVSSDGTDWDSVATGTWGASDGYMDLQHAAFAPVTAQYVKLVGVTTAVAPGADEVAGKIIGTAAEIYVGYPTDD